MRAAEFGQGCVINCAFGFPRAFVPGEKRHVRIFRAMRHRNSSISRPGDGRCYSGYNLKINSGIDNRFCFFGAAPENKWIAALQPDNPFSRARFFDQERVDFFLAKRVLACFFPRIDNFRLVSRPVEHFRVGQMIVHDHVRLLDTFLGSQRNQPKVPWPRANKINFANALFTGHCFVHTRWIARSVARC